MHLKQLLHDDEAVSPVIGVILMVAITVILAAVIGTFVLGLGSQVQQSPPNAQFDWNEESNGDLTVSLQSGESIDVARLEMKSDGAAVSCSWSGLSNSKLSAGSTCTITPTDGDTYRLVWTSEGGGQSSTLTSYTYEA